MYTVYIAEIKSDGTLDKTLLQSSDLTFNDPYFSMADDGSDIKFSCIAAGTTPAATMTYTDAQPWNN